MVRGASRQYATLEDYQNNTAPSIAMSLGRIERYTLTCEEKVDATTSIRRGMGIDILEEEGLFYDETQPYLYLSTPLAARFPYGPDYDLPESPMYLNIPSYPTYDSSTRVYYNVDDAY
jgi:hypothetical protein